MKTRILAFAIVAAMGVIVQRPILAQSDPYQWSGTVADAKTIEIRGMHGSIRAIRSDDDLIHVEALRSDPAGTRIEVVDHDNGVTLCAVSSAADECGPFSVAAVPIPAVEPRRRVDFTVRVPEGVRFAASIRTGQIAVDGLRSGIDLAPLEGDVTIRLPDDANVDFDANTISGRIESDFVLRSDDRQLFNAPNPLLPTGRDGGVRMPQIIHARIGKGGQPVRVLTINGDVRLARR